MCDANQSVIAELIAIIGSSLVQILLQHHKLAFAIGYTPDVALDIPTVFVQMMVELLLETIVDSTVMWAEGEHGIPITRYFEHVRSLHVAGCHMAYSIIAVAWVMFSFIRFPTIATCASSNVCECLDKPQFEAWFANECNQTAANQTQASPADADDMFEHVDGFTVIIAMVTGISMTALIALSVLFARYRRVNSKITDLVAAANPTTRLALRPPQAFTAEDFDVVLASVGRAGAAQLLLALCEEWIFVSPITEAKWDYFKACVVPLTIWDNGDIFERLRAAAERSGAPLDDALRKIISGLAGDSGDGEWLCKRLQSIKAEESVAEAAGPWFPADLASPVQSRSERVRDKYDADVLPDALRFLASDTYSAFGDALLAALPSTAFHEGEGKGARRASITSMAAASSKPSLMVRYSFDKCVKQVKRMKAKVRLAQEIGEAPRPRVATIGDALRASVCASSAAGMRTAWEHFVAPSAPWKVVRMKNKVRLLMPQKTPL